MNRSLQLETKLHGRACPHCRTVGRLIQKKPRDYKQVRCLQCGGIFAFVMPKGG